jgi:glutamine synthetase type III
MLATPEDDMAGAMTFASLSDAVAVAMKQWSMQHCAFTVETFFLNGDSVVKTQ